MGAQDDLGVSWNPVAVPGVWSMSYTPGMPRLIGDRKVSVFVLKNARLEI